MTFKEIRDYCKRYDELEVRVNISKIQQNSGTAAKDDTTKLTELQIKMDTIKQRVQAVVNVPL